MAQAGRLHLRASLWTLTCSSITITRTAAALAIAALETRKGSDSSTTSAANGSDARKLKITTKHVKALYRAASHRSEANGTCAKAGARTANTHLLTERADGATIRRRALHDLLDDKGKEEKSPSFDALWERPDLLRNEGDWGVETGDRVLFATYLISVRRGLWVVCGCGVAVLLIHRTFEIASG